jgi:hypothetical protein
MSYKLTKINEAEPTTLSLTDVAGAGSTPVDGDFIAFNNDAWGIGSQNTELIEKVGSAHHLASYGGGGSSWPYMYHRSSEILDNITMETGGTWNYGFKINYTGSVILEATLTNYAPYDGVLRFEVGGVEVGNAGRIALSLGRFGGTIRARTTITPSTIIKIKKVGGDLGTQSYLSYTLYSLIAYAV